MDTLKEYVLGLGGRPAKPKLVKSLGSILKGSINFSHGQYDITIGKKLSQQNNTLTSGLLERYVGIAILYYAKQAFGETHFISTKGLDSDPKELFDAYQASQSGTESITRPLLPGELVALKLKESIRSMLYDPKSPLNDIFKHTGSDNQQFGRENRQRLYCEGKDHHSFSGSGQYEFHNKDQFGQSNSSSFEEPLKSYADKKRASPAFVNPIVGDLQREFSRLRYGVKAGSNALEDMQKVETEFTARLTLFENTPGEDIPSLSRILRDAMAENHPDINKDNSQAQEYFKLYSLIRDALFAERHPKGK